MSAKKLSPTSHGRENWRQRPQNVNKSRCPYVCTIKALGRDTGWISKTIGVNIDRKTGVVLVSDALILEAYKKPIAVTLILNTSKRVSVKWEVSGLKDVRNVTYPRFLYKLTIFKSLGNKASVKAHPSGSYRVLNGNGKCVLRK